MLTGEEAKCNKAQSQPLYWCDTINHDKESNMVTSLYINTNIHEGEGGTVEQNQ